MIRRYFLIAAILMVFTPALSWAKTGAEIDQEVTQTIQRLRKEQPEAVELIDAAKGMLVFPKVYGAGFVVGGEYGEGALRVGTTTARYYSTSGVSIGFQAGAEARSIVLLFMTEAELEKFQKSEGWQVGVDGRVTIIDTGAGKKINTRNVEAPVIGFVFGNQGLMAGISLEGSKFNPIAKS
jgi:lipid-binding SYLF domain-containing protein